MTDSLSNSNDSATDVLNLFTAENLLSASPIMGQVLKLRDNLSRTSDGNFVDYDDMFRRIQDEVDVLPVLELQQNVASGTEGAYQRQLLHALEKINDDHDRVLRKMLKMKSRLVNAISLMKIQRSQFAAFYNLAIPVAIHATNIPKLKLTAANIKEMAAGEYSRLMDNLDQAAPSLVSELKILEIEIKGRKAAQAAKYALGKDQVNAMWNSFQSNGPIGLDDNPNALIKTFPVEDEDEVPSFVSRHTKEVRTAANASFVKPPQTLCSVCGEKQVDSPSGITCINGHGGENPEDDEEIELKGTFFKKGDPQLITPIANDDGKELFVEGSKARVITMPQWSDEQLNRMGDEEPGGLMACSPEIYAEIKAQNEITGPDAEGLAMIAEIARKINAETLAQAEADRAAKEKTTNEPLVTDYRAKWDNLQPTTTQALLIEDIEDSPPDTTQEAALGELELPDFKPLTTPAWKAVISPEKVVPADDFEDIMNAAEPLATQAPTTQRKKLMILEEDEL